MVVVGPASGGTFPTPTGKYPSYLGDVQGTNFVPVVAFQVFANDSVEPMDHGLGVLNNATPSAHLPTGHVTYPNKTEKL